MLETGIKSKVYLAFLFVSVLKRAGHPVLF